VKALKKYFLLKKLEFSKPEHNTRQVERERYEEENYFLFRYVHEKLLIALHAISSTFNRYRLHSWFLIFPTLPYHTTFSLLLALMLMMSNSRNVHFTVKMS
jgi:hypothetical protein